MVVQNIQVLNCVIGGDMNTDMSRTKSGNTVSLRNFIRDENLNMVLINVDNSVEYTYRGINNIVSLIESFYCFGKYAFAYWRLLY